MICFDQGVLCCCIWLNSVFKLKYIPTLIAKETCTFGMLFIQWRHARTIEYSLICSVLMWAFIVLTTRSMFDVWKSVSHEEGRHKMASRKGCLVAGVCFSPKWKLIIYVTHPIFQGMCIATEDNIAFFIWIFAQYLSGCCDKISNQVWRGMGGCRGSVVPFVHKWQHREAKGTSNWAGFSCYCISQNINLLAYVGCVAYFWGLHAVHCNNL